MLVLEVHALSLPVAAAVFTLSSLLVWRAGSRLALHADALAGRTAWGQAYVGLVLLAVATDLPELVTSVAAAATGEARLAVNGLFGTIAANTAILAVADLWIGAGALTFFTVSVRVTLQGLAVVLLLVLALLGMAVAEPAAPMGVGVFATAGLLAYLGCIAFLARLDPDRRWRPMDLPDALHEGPLRATPRARPLPSTRSLGLAFATWSCVLLVAGLALVASATSLAHRTGLGSGFVGATLLAAATSLPEVSTTLGAVRLGAYGLAFGNVFGSNALAVALLFVVDAVDPGPPILGRPDRTALLGAVVGVGLTTVYLVGLLTRSRRTVARMGLDSVVVLLAYGATLYGFHRLR